MKAGMKLLSLALGALSIAPGILSEITKENGVLVLTDQNFEEALSANPNGLLVEMYAPWCGHCKALAPEYEKAAENLAKEGYSISKLDATEHKETAAMFNVQGFPTIKYIVNGVDMDYNGERTAEAITNYVIKKNGPPAIALDSEEAIEKFAASGIVVIGYFSDESSPEATMYKNVASTMDDFLFGIVTEAGLIKKFSPGPNTVQLHKDFDERKHDFTVTGDTTPLDIAGFVSAYSMPLTLTYTPETARAIFGGPITDMALFFTDNFEGELLDAAQAAARKFRGKIMHVQIKSDEGRVAEYFGVEAKDYPTMVMADMGEIVRKYLIGDTPLTEENVIKFEEDFLAGKLTPFLKSEDPEEGDLKGPVKVVRGKSFDEIVLESEENVFVKFYAPWCGHCQTLAPKWEELGEKMDGVEGIVIAKMDNTQNEVDAPGVNVESFPTLLFFPAGDKENPIAYNGEREVSDLVDYVEKMSLKYKKSPTKDEL